MGPIPTSSSLSMSRADLEGGFTPTSSSGGQIQIFNIEAYCKLCNKEFCNKYFLKTHLANKHGIYSDSSSSAASSGQTAGPRFDGGSLYDKPPMKFPGSSQPQVSISGSFMAMSSPKTSSAGLLRESPKEAGERPQSHTEMRSPLPSPIRPHSTGATERSTPGSQQSPKPGPPPLIPGRPGSGLGARPEENGDREGPEDLKRMDKEMMRPGLDMGSLPSGIRLPMVPSMSPFGGPMHFDNLLKMSPLSPMDQMRKEADMDNDLDKSNRPIPNVPNVPSKSSEGGSGGQNGNMTPDRLRQMGVINADAFCEFCCKEFCNKYFLRVHKLKKHGVCSPELPPEKVQKILQQMAKEAGKTGQPMPPLTMGAPSAIRPPGSMAEPPRSMSGPMGPMAGPFGSMGSLGSMGGPLNLIRPPHLPNFLNLPGLEPGSGAQQVSREDSQSSSSSDKQEAADRDREDREGRPLNFSANSPRSSLIEPECELKIDENAPVIESPNRKDPEDLSEAAEDQEMAGGQRPTEEDQREGEASEGLANLQNMIMKLHGRTMMGQEPRDSGTKSPVPVSLPQYPADLSKMGDKQQPGGFSPGLNIPNPLLSRQPSLHSLANGFPKLSDKGPSIFEQMQGLPRPSFMDQIKKDLGGGGGIDIPLSPMKRPSLDRDPNKKPASLSRSYCEICKKELCNKYFMKTHMMKMHGIMMEDGPPKNNVMPSLDSDHLKSRLPPHMRDNGLMSGMFPGMPGSGEFPAPPPLGEFSRLLMQQGEKNLERQKAELERREREAGPGHVCSLCSNTFPDIIALQVHIIKSHGALPPTTGLDGLFGARQEDKDEDKEAETRDDIAENEEKETEDQEQERASSPAAPPAMFPFPMAGLGGQESGEASKNLQELMARQMQFPGMINPLMGLPMGLAGAGAAPNSQFQGLFNMFLSEMLKKVQKDTPPQTPPSSPPPQEEACLEEEARS